MDASSDAGSGLAVKVASLCGLLCVTLLCGLAPLCAFKGRGRCDADPAIRRKVLNLVSSFAGGVFLATCLLDQVPGYLKGMDEAFNSLEIKLQFPLPEFILAMGFFLVLVMEQTVLACKDQVWAAAEERRALLVEPSVQLQGTDRQDTPTPPPPPQPPPAGGEEESSREGGGPHRLHDDRAQLSAVCAFVLVFSLSLHAALGGLAGGLRGGGGRGLALKLWRGRLRRAVVAGCLLLFSLASPVGVAVGVALSEAGATPHRRLARSALEGLAVGAFVFITFMEILPQELGAPHCRLPKLALLLTGFAVVTGLMFIKI
ncbi:hypothetical protein AAFF_G00250620 [Aldrovandia affinis]|uniref:Zinc transporter ZIP1 n=1 Tax=Aldrovandia affinis TaxID=143900 RepID=A0AAD7RCS6_9TELE|nr:hypothetical protein AAFF_G00250620 [Aldrovandia affinis]